MIEEEVDLAFDAAIKELRENLKAHIFAKTLELISLVRVVDDPEINKMKLQAVINAAKDAISYK